MKRPPRKPTVIQHHIDLNVHWHDPASTRMITEQLNQIGSQLGRLHTQGDRLMAISQDLKASMADIDVATTELGERVDALTAKVGVGMTQEDVDEVVGQGQAISARLKGMAVDPANPVPPDDASATSKKRK